jgi:5-methylcytosine-specific restriction endonuclease McrA
MITLPPDQHAHLVEQLRNYRVGEWNANLGLEQEFRCAYCDKDFLASFDNYNSWQWDHIIPQSLNGEHNCENIVLCCKTCNWLKNTYSPNGNTKSERVADARRYVQQRRIGFEAEVTEIRELVREIQKKFK